MIRGMREIRDTLIEGFVFDTNIFKARGADETDLKVDRDSDLVLNCHFKLLSSI